MSPKVKYFTHEQFRPCTTVEIVVTEPVERTWDQGVYETVSLEVVHPTPKKKVLGYPKKNK